jgi:hypothetical protein
VTWLEDIGAGVRLLWDLPSFLRTPLSPAAARAALDRRLERRDQDFLDLARLAIFGATQSPYRRLLAHAGFSYGDLAALVHREGLDGALRVLYAAGVYLTVDEFKGRRPIVRGSLQMTLEPTAFGSPLTAVHIPTLSSGSRGNRTVAGTSLAHLRDQAVGLCLFLQARGPGHRVHGHCGVPGGSALHGMLRNYYAGLPLGAWFSHVDPAAQDLHPRYRWSIRVVRLGAWIARRPFPVPRYVRPDDPDPILTWMVAARRQGMVPHFRSTPSTAVLVCQAASDSGIDISGTEFMPGGEPLTPARLQVIARTGVKTAALYASVESGHIGYGCLSPAAADDLHLLSDLQAVIQPGEPSNGTALPAEALLLTSLRLSAPFILLNVASGDQARLEQRACGCPLHALGWTTHLHTIRSYAKLTTAGMTFLDADLIRVLEEVLPARFGGGPTHYQLVEEEQANGRPTLRLLVHPLVGPVDSAAVADAFFSAIGTAPGAARVMELFWRDAGVLRVERLAPLATATGKIQHLHQHRKTTES